MINEEFQNLVLKQLQSLNEGQNQLSERLGSVEKRLGSVEKRLDSVEKGQANIDAKVDRIDTGLLKLETRMETEVIDKIGALFDGYNLRGDQIKNLQKHLDERLDSIEIDTGYLVSRVARLEKLAK